MILNKDTLLVYEVSKKEIESNSYTRIMNLLTSIQENKANARSSVIIYFYGYDDVVEELFEIPEVRKWIQGLVTRVPYLFYFLNFELESHHGIIGSLGDIEKCFFGEHISIQQRVERGESSEKLPRLLVSIRFHEKFYYIMKKGIETYCNLLNDQLSKKELIDKIEQFI